MRRVNQSGLSLLELLFTLLLFSITLSALLQYYQVLQQQSLLQLYQQRAWRQAHFLLQHGASEPLNSSLPEELSQWGIWPYQFSEQKKEGCNLLTVTVTPPLGGKSSLTEWRCYE